ncbi:hypothetical protein A4X09_0g1321 [Tilletia walkeri]|uniref:Nucleoporin Nup54 alpha-helical domain-containing protein n=1 Tax=Tilletia walkeri TaxID=117179 RepID=A0A8X7NDR8_9BASI|nr:hypothetical protein A4X09_0g1321 [Tilletia walkeri]
MAFTFGAPAASTATSTAAPAAAAFSFGAKPAATPSTGGTGLFGQPTSSQPASTSTTTTGSLFGAGSTASTAPAQPASSGFSLFGAKPATTSAPAGTLGTSLFGSTQPASAPAPAATTGGLFGGGASTSTSAAAQPASTSLFGQPQQQQQQQQTAQQQQQQAILSPSSQLRKLGSPLSPQLSYIYDSWNLSNPSTCSFLYYFYNNVGVDAVQALLAQVGGGGWGSMRMMEVLRRRDALGAVNDALWEAAVRGNPDPTRLVPVLAVGFPDLAKRRAAQQAESDRIASTLSACSKRTDELLKSHTLGNTARLESAQRRQVVLHARILGLARRYWRLLEGGKSGLVQGGFGGVPSSSSPSSGGGFGASTSGAGTGGAGAGAESAEWQRQDERTREVLEACNAIVNGSGPGSGSGSGSGGGGLEMSAWNGQGAGAGDGGPPLAAKLAELWPKVANLSARRAAKAAASGGGGGAGSAQQSGGGWAVVDQEGVEEVAQILASQQAGLAHLTQTLNQDRAIVSALGEMLKGVRIVAN